MTKDYKETEFKKLVHLLDKSMLFTLKEVFERCIDLLDSYYQQRVVLLKKQLGPKFVESEAKNKFKMYTNRDNLLKNSLVQFKMNIKTKIFRELNQLAPEIKESKSKELEQLVKEYERYEFLDLEQRELLAQSELFDYMRFLKNKQMEEFEKIIFQVS